jgi:hypothetical protein
MTAKEERRYIQDEAEKESHPIIKKALDNTLWINAFKTDDETALILGRLLLEWLDNPSRTLREVYVHGSKVVSDMEHEVLIVKIVKS